MAINASLFKNMTYDPRTDFEPVTLVATFPLVFIAPATTTQSLKELIEAARAKPDSVSYGSIGSGSPQHLAAELLSSMAKARFLHIPYKGSGPLVQDAVGGHVEHGREQRAAGGAAGQVGQAPRARGDVFGKVGGTARRCRRWRNWASPVTSSTPGSASPCRRARPKEVVDRLRDGMSRCPRRQRGAGHVARPGSRPGRHDRRAIPPVRAR